MLQEEAKKRKATSGPGMLGAKPLMLKSTQAIPVNEISNIPKGSARSIVAKEGAYQHVPSRFVQQWSRRFFS